MMEDDENLIESSRLLPLTSDDSEDAPNRVPDLNLPKPVMSPSNGIQGRTRRKIRLKRRDRNYRMSNNGNGHPFMSDGSIDNRSGDSDCFCRPRSSSTYAGSSRRRLLPPPCTAIFLLFVVSVVAALFSLTYFAVSLHGQISALTMHLEAVMEDKKLASDEHHQIQMQFDALFSNQTSLLNNVASLFKNVQGLSSDLETMNASVANVLKSLQAAPLLTSLPTTVLQVQTDLARLGSRVTDLEAQLASAQTDLHESLENLNKTLDNIEDQKSAKDDNRSDHRPRDADQSFVESYLNQTARTESRLGLLESNFKEFATKITDQLQRQEIRATKSWELLSQLEDNIQNVSAKALSSDVICNKNQEKLNLLEDNLKNVKTLILSREKEGKTEEETVSKKP